MNKGKENYQNIPLPEGLSDSIQEGIQKGKKRVLQKRIISIGSVAAVCVLAFAAFRFLPSGGPVTLEEGADDASPAQVRTADAADPGVDTPATIPAEDEPAATPDGDVPADSGENTPAAQPETNAVSSIQVYGNVTEIEDGKILLENDNTQDPYSSILLNITQDTLLLDAADFSSRQLSDISVGDTLYAYVSPAMTRSIPPMSNAAAIFCNVAEDSAAPAYAQITDISGEADGTLYITTNQDLILIPSEETRILSLDGSETLTAGDLQIGDQILVSYSFMTMSIPAQTNPEEIRLLPAAGSSDSSEN